MADETTQTGEETSWWAFDAFADSELPSTAFDEPLEWPETLDWGAFAAADGDLQFPSIDDLAAEPIFPAAPAPPPAPAPPAQQAAEDGGDPTMPHVTVLSGLGGSAAPAPPAGDRQRLPDSLWAPAPTAGTAGNGKAQGNGAPPVVTTTMAAPAFYAEPDSGAGGWRRRFDLRHGNAAVIALISFVSLVLLGMFMSVRARNDLPDTSQTRTTSDQIAVQGPLNTVPLTTPATTNAPPPINIAELVPPAEDATTVTAGSGSGSGGGSTATTAAPARSTPAASTATTQPAATTEPTTATTAAPQSTTQPQTTNSSTPPADQTTPTTPRRTTPTINWPTSIPDNSGPTYTIPNIPGFPSIPNPN